MSKGVLDPPIFEPDQDLLVWRKRVASWVELISVAATKGTDKQYKTVYATWARQLYDRGLRQAQKSLVEEAQEQGKIDYKQEDQVKAVQEIVDLIAVDPPIAVVTRLIDSFNKVTSCKKKPGEDLTRFVSRFRGLATEHMMLAGATQSSQIGEVLAITLLNNASLPDATLTNAKLQLIALAESRKKDAEDVTIALVSDYAKKLIDSKETLTTLLEGLRVRNSDNREAIRQKTLEADRTVKALLEEIEGTISKLTREIEARKADAPTRAITTTGPRCVLSLDDAVLVLRSLAQTSPKQEPPQFDRNQFVDAVTKEVRSLLGSQPNGFQKDSNQERQPSNGKHSNFGKRPRGRNSDSWNSSKRGRFNRSRQERPRMSEVIGDDICKDCGSDKHLRGSNACESPSFATRKLNEASTKASGHSRTRDETPPPQGFFRPGSWRTKDKRA